MKSLRLALAAVAILLSVGFVGCAGEDDATPTDSTTTTTTDGTTTTTTE